MNRSLCHGQVCELYVPPSGKHDGSLCPNCGRGPRQIHTNSPTKPKPDPAREERDEIVRIIVNCQKLWIRDAEKGFQKYVNNAKAAACDEILRRIGESE